MVFCNDWSHSPAPVQGPNQGDGLENQSGIPEIGVEHTVPTCYNFANCRMRGTW